MNAVDESDRPNVVVIPDPLAIVIALFTLIIIEIKALAPLASVTVIVSGWSPTETLPRTVIEPLLELILIPESLLIENTLVPVPPVTV